MWRSSWWHFKRGGAETLEYRHSLLLPVLKRDKRPLKIDCLHDRNSLLVCLCAVSVCMAKQNKYSSLVCPRVRVRVQKRVPSNFGPRNRVKEGKRFQEGIYINAKKDLDKMQDVNQRYLK